MTAHYEIREDGTPRLRGDIDYKLRSREKQFELGEAELDEHLRSDRKPGNPHGTKDPARNGFVFGKILLVQPSFA